MDAEQEELLKRTHHLVEENHKILKHLQRKERLAFLVSIIKFIIFVLFVAGAYYYLQPYLQQMLKLYSSIQQGADTLKNISNVSATQNIPDLSEILKAIGKN